MRSVFSFSCTFFHERATPTATVKRQDRLIPLLPILSISPVTVFNFQEYSEDVSEDEEIVVRGLCEVDRKDIKYSQKDFYQREVTDLKLKVSNCIKLLITTYLVGSSL